MTSTIALLHEDADRTRLARIHAIAHEHFGGGVRRSDVFDLPLKLSLMRAAFHLAPSVWDDQTISHILFGGDKGHAAAKFSRIKYGTARFDEKGTSMLAALINYVASVQPVCDEQVKLEQRAEVLDWIVGFEPGTLPWITARDVTGDTLELASRLFAMAEAHRYEPRGRAMRANAQDCIVEYLLAPIDMAERDQRLVLRESSPTEAAAAREARATGADRMLIQRFGKTQRPGAHPRQWKPVSLTPGNLLEISVPHSVEIPSTGWLMTLRNAAHADLDRADERAWAWLQGWENTLRWLPRFDLPANAPIAAPTGADDRILPLAGRYQVFFFVEPAESKVLSDFLVDHGPLSSANLPSDSGYLRLAGELLNALQNKKPSPFAGTGIRVYTSSYTVTA